MKCVRDFSFGVLSFISGEELFIIIIRFWRAVNQFRRRNSQNETLALMVMVSIIISNDNKSVCLAVLVSSWAYIKEVPVGFLLPSSLPSFLQFVCYNWLSFLFRTFSKRPCLLMFARNFKNAILSSDSLQTKEDPPLESAHISGESSSPGRCPVVPSPALGAQDPPADVAYPEVVIVYEVLQVQRDIQELSKSCLIGKMLDEPLDMCTIISRTKVEWKFVKGDIEFLDMGNHWILLKFANPNDLFLVWSERPWHVQSELFVLQAWHPNFDPFLEELKWVDLWVRIPRFPTELLNFESMANLFVANNVGVLIKLDSNSLLRNKIRFARACIRVDITAPLLEYAELSRGGGECVGMSYEDFSSGCSFCGCEDHTIDACPLLHAPKNEINIYLLKSPKQKNFVDILSLATRQDHLATRAVEANVVQAKPKSNFGSYGNKHGLHNNSKNFSKFVTPAGESGPPVGKRNVSGVIIKEPSKVVPSPPVIPIYGKGKGKAVMFAFAPYYDNDSGSDDDSANVAAPPQLPFSPCFQASLLDYSHCENGEGEGLALAPSVPLGVELSPVPLQVIYPDNYYHANQFGPLVQVSDQNYGSFSLFESGVENDTMIILDDSKSESDIQALNETSFHSIDSESSIVRHINAMGVEQEPPYPYSLSSAAKRRKGNNGDDSASLDLKRSKV